VFYAAKNIPEAEVRQVWISSCLDQSRLLEKLSCINEGTGSKRPRATSQQDQDGETNCSKRVKQAASIKTTTASPINPQAGNTRSFAPFVSQLSSALNPFEEFTSDRCASDTAGVLNLFTSISIDTRF
jgi:hypothetical protein